MHHSMRRGDSPVDTCNRESMPLPGALSTRIGLSGASRSNGPAQFFSSVPDHHFGVKRPYKCGHPTARIHYRQLSNLTVCRHATLSGRIPGYVGQSLGHDPLLKEFGELRSVSSPPLNSDGRDRIRHSLADLARLLKDDYAGPGRKTLPFGVTSWVED
jgi:hypothetical protein